MKIKLNESFFGKTTIDEIIAELNAPEQLEKVVIFDAGTDKVVFSGSASEIPAKFLRKEVEGVYMYDAEFVISSDKNEKLKESYGDMASETMTDGTKLMAVGSTRSTRTYNYEEVRFRFGNKEGFGKYGWQNRPWQRFDFASALQSAMIDAGVDEAFAKECIEKSSGLRGALEYFAKNFKASGKTESKKLKEEADGWIALLDDKKVEIRKGEADSLWSAKKLAIQKFAKLFGRPLSKARELQIVIAPAYDEENLEKAPASGAQFESKKKGLTEKAFVKFDDNWELTKTLTKEQADALLSFVTKELQVKKRDITTQTVESEKGDLTYLIIPVFRLTDEQFDMFRDFTSRQGLQHQYGHDSEWFVVPTDFKSELIEGVKMYEAPVSKLSPRFDARQSFYGKARVEEAEDGTLTLISYRTPVAKIKGGKVELLPLWSTSQTTLRHVKEFLKQHGFKADSFAQMSKDYEAKKESVKEGRDGGIIVIAPHMTFQEMKDYCEIWQCEVINTGVVGKYKLVGQDAEVVRDELKGDGHLEESMKEEVKTSKGPFTIEYWATEVDREEGFGELFIDSFEDLEEAKQVAKQMIDRDSIVSAEVLDVNNEVVFGYDGVETWTEANKPLKESNQNLNEMKYDKKIKQQVRLLQSKIKNWLDLTNDATDAYSDRALEEIFELAKKTEEIHEKRFLEELNETHKKIEKKDLLYVKEMAEGDWEVGKTFSKDDFRQFVRICKEDGIIYSDEKIYEDLFDYYYEVVDEQKLLEGPDQFGMTDDEFKKETDRLKKDYGQARKARLKSGNAKIGDNAKIVLFGHKNRIPYSLSNIAFSFSDSYRQKNFPHISNVGHEHQKQAVEEIIRRAPATAEGLAKELNQSGIGHTTWKPFSEDDNSFTIQAEDGFGNLVDLKIVLFAEEME